MNEEIRALGDLGDALERAKRAHDLLTHHQAITVELTRIRKEAMGELLASGMTNTQLSAELGVSKGRVSQLTKSGPPLERAFLGTGPLTVALGGKLEADRAKPGPVLAQEDFSAYEHIRSLAEHLQLKTQYEVIKPPGLVHLNRDNLIVICGPRLSPLIAQILESDPHLRFARDENGWYLIDDTADRTYRSPMDSDKPGDIAYFGRLPRPDGKGTFLYIAGIHAMGSNGIVHWLTRNITEAYHEIKAKRFSTLIESTFDPDTREIVSSQRITPFYQP